MKKHFTVIISMVFALSALAPLNAQSTGEGEDDWPRTINSGNQTFKVYRLQADQWDGYTLRAHAAVSVQDRGYDSREIHGTISISAKTLADRGAGTAQLEDVVIERLNFPSERNGGQLYMYALQRGLPNALKVIPLEGMADGLRDDNEDRGYKLENNPPGILFSQFEAVLVPVDGKPVYAPVKGTSLQRVINTSVLLLKGNGKFYLHVFDGYMEADSLEGPWSVTGEVPRDVRNAERAVRDSDQIDFLEESVDGNGSPVKPSLRGGAPRIYVSTVPAELIVTRGEPDYRSIEGTDLLYVRNTVADVFKDLNDQRTYVLLSGRWFRSFSLNGPWEYVPADNLPEDFSEIPDDHEKADVKASVPGTEQAKEARKANEIPTIEKVGRYERLTGIEFDGEPQLRRIYGTPIGYVVNTSLPVIKVDDYSWYSVKNGVWYAATSARGPWAVAVNVPAVIYTIPVTSSLHFVTYVKIYDVTPQYVYFGYTPGYYGTVLSDDGIVVYGTGYVYPCYIGRYVWYGCPHTYGYGFSMIWSPWHDWSFTFGYGYYRPWHHHHDVYLPRPHWGPYRYSRQLPGWAMNTSQNAYRPQNASTPVPAPAIRESRTGSWYRHKQQFERKPQPVKPPRIAQPGTQTPNETIRKNKTYGGWYSKPKKNDTPVPGQQKVTEQDNTPVQKPVVRPAEQKKTRAGAWTNNGNQKKPAENKAVKENKEERNGDEKRNGENRRGGAWYQR